jgi:hypothetical protein
MSEPKFNRPPLAEALAAWQERLAAKKLPTQCQWIFAENLCLEPSNVTPGTLRVGFQTKFSTPPDDALEIAYDIFGATAAPLVFYRLGSSERGSVCILLCDAWFEDKKVSEGFESKDGWGISFFAGGSEAIEEITDLTRWLRREKGGRNPQALDFAMSLATIDEIKIYGRTLMPYERFAENMLGRLRRMLGQP